MRADRLVPLMVLGLAACRPGAPRPREVAPRPYAPLTGQPGATTIAFSLPRDGAPPTLATMPFPGDLWRAPTGYDLRGFPLAASPLASRYVDAAARLDGASTSPTMYVRFVGPAPFASLPARDATTARTSAIQLLDVDPSSPERGRRFPLELRGYPADTTYVPGGTLALRPVPGVMLRPSTSYALVVLRALTSPPLGTPDAHEHVKWTTPRADTVEEKARALFAPALDQLATDGIARGDVAAITVFRTHRPDAVGRAAAAAGARAAGRIVVATWEPGAALPGPDGYDVVKGLYCTPNYQASVDDAPFTTRGGAARSRDGALEAVPLPERWRTPECGPQLRARFVLTVPRRRAPGDVPLIVTAHGTNGDAFSFVGARDFAGWAAAEGVAVVSTDQPLHGTPGDPGARPGRSAQVSLALGPLRLPLADFPAPMMFYNPLRPEAAEGNMAQAIADAATLVGTFAGLDAASLTGLAARPDVPGFRLSRDRVGLAGHSQGSQSLAILGALDPRISTVVLSGCGGDVRFGALHNKEIAPLRDFIAGYLGFAPGELDEFHPLLAAIGWVAMTSDPEAYARGYRDGGRPRAVLHIGGLGDRYNPEASADALARALGATPLAPVARPIDWLAAPSTRVAANAPGGAALAYLQLQPTKGEDGHFVMYREARAWDEVRRAFATLAAGRAATFGMLPSGHSRPRSAPGAGGAVRSPPAGQRRRWTAGTRGASIANRWMVESSSEYWLETPGASEPAGPYLLEDLVAFVAAKRVDSSARVCQRGSQRWQSLSDVLDESVPVEVSANGVDIVGPVWMHQVRRGIDLGKIPGGTFIRRVGSATWAPMSEFGLELPRRLIPDDDPEEDKTTLLATLVSGPHEGPRPPAAPEVRATASSPRGRPDDAPAPRRSRNRVDAEVASVVLQPDADEAAQPRARPGKPSAPKGPAVRASGSRRRDVWIASAVVLLGGAIAGGIVIAQRFSGPSTGRPLPLVAQKLPPRSVQVEEGRMMPELEEFADLPDAYATSALADVACGGLNVARILAGARGEAPAVLRQKGVLDILHDKRVRGSLACAVALRPTLLTPTIANIAFTDDDRPHRVAIVRSSAAELTPAWGYMRQNFSGLPGHCTPTPGGSTCADPGFAAVHDGPTWIFGTTAAVGSFARAYTSARTELSSNVDILQETVALAVGSDHSTVLARPDTIDWTLICRQAAPVNKSKEFVEACFPSGQGRLLEAISAKVRGAAIERDIVARSNTIHLQYVLLARDAAGAVELEKDLLDLARDWRAHIANREPELVRMARAPSPYVHDDFLRAEVEPLLRALRGMTVRRSGKVTTLTVHEALSPAERKSLKEFMETRARDQQAVADIVDALSRGTPVREKSLEVFFEPEVVAWMVAPRATMDDCAQIRQRATSLATSVPPGAHSDDIAARALKELLEQRYSPERCVGMVLPSDSKSCLMGATSQLQLAGCPLPTSPVILAATKRLQGVWEVPTATPSKRSADSLVRLEVAGSRITAVVGTTRHDGTLDVDLDEGGRLLLGIPGRRPIRRALTLDESDRLKLATEHGDVVLRRTTEGDTRSR